MSFDVQAAIAAAAAQGPNMTEAVSGGGERELPAAGLVRLRLVRYLEIGKHIDKDMQGKEKIVDQVVLTWELSGPKHPPMDINGVKTPMTMDIYMTLSLNEKANFFKLFKRLNYDGQATHFAQLLGKDFLGTIVHVEKGEGADKRTYANLKDESGFTIRPPYIVTVNEETGEEGQKRINAEPALSPLKCFLWNFSSKEMWDSLFIDGKWDDKKDKDGKVVKEGASKNYWQNKIKSAVNFNDSPLAAILGAGGEPDLPGAETPDRAANDEDPLASAA
jgi:hypothetical protein